MSRKLGLLIIFVVAVVLGTALHLHEAGGFDSVQSPLAIAGKSIGIFIAAGFLPVIVWACLKFRATHLRWIMIAWIVLELLDAAYVYSGLGPQLVAG